MKEGRGKKAHDSSSWHRRLIFRAGTRLIFPNKTSLHSYRFHLAPTSKVESNIPHSPGGGSCLFCLPRSTLDCLLRGSSRRLRINSIGSLIDQPEGCLSTIGPLTLTVRQGNLCSLMQQTEVLGRSRGNLAELFRLLPVCTPLWLVHLRTGGTKVGFRRGYGDPGRWAGRCCTGSTWLMVRSGRGRYSHG